MTHVNLDQSLRGYTASGCSSRYTLAGWYKLVLEWRAVHSHSGREEKIEARMENVLPDILPGISDWNDLVEMWGTVSADSAPEKLIIVRMQTVLLDMLPGITKWDELVAMRQKVSSFAPRQLIDERMAELIADVTDTDVPMWFLHLLEAPDDCAVRSALDKKVEELRAQLSIC